MHQPKPGQRTLTNNAATLARDALAARMGLGAKRDLYEECQYPKYITPDMYWDTYSRQGVAARVVEVYPEECWATTPEVYEVEDAEATPFEQALKDVFDEHNIWHYLHRVDILSGIGCFGLLLLGVDDGQPLDRPLDLKSMRGKPQHTTPSPGYGGAAAGEVRGIGAGAYDMGLQPDAHPMPEPSEASKGTGDSTPPNSGSPTGEWEGSGTANRSLLFIRAFDEHLIRIDSYETNIHSPRFGQPLTYAVKFADPRNQPLTAGAPEPAQTEMKVHWTRVIHVADNRKSSEVIGTPRQHPVYNNLLNLQKILGGSGEMFWKGGFPGISFEVDEGLEDVELDPEAIRQEFEKYSNSLQRYIAVQGVTAKMLNPVVADPQRHFEVNIQEICITIGVPMRVFMGSEEAKLAASEDSRAWRRRVKRRQTEYLGPCILRVLVDRLIDIGVLPEPTGKPVARKSPQKLRGGQPLPGAGGEGEEGDAEERPAAQPPAPRGAAPSLNEERELKPLLTLNIAVGQAATADQVASVKERQGEMDKQKRRYKYAILWPDLATPSDEDRAKVAGMRTDTMAKYIGGNVETLIAPREFLTLIMGLTVEEADMVLATRDDFVAETEGKGTEHGWAMSAAEEIELEGAKAKASAAANPPPFGAPGPPAKGAAPGTPGKGNGGVGAAQGRSAGPASAAAVAKPPKGAQPPGPPRA